MADDLNNTLPSDDQLAKAGFKEVAPPPEPQHLSDVDPQMPVNDAVLKQNGFKEITTPQVDYSKLDAAPNAFKQSADAGSHVLSQLPPKTSSGWSPMIGKTMQTIHDTLHNFDDPGTSYTDLAGQASAQSEETLKEGISDIFANRPATGVAKAGWGALGMAFAPITGFAKKVENEVTYLTGNAGLGEKAGFAVGMISPFPEIGPVVKAQDGMFARLHVNEAGQVDAKIIGKPPQPDDFKLAAHQITEADALHKSSVEERQAAQEAQAKGLPVPSKGDHSQDHVTEQKLLDRWQVYGQHPAEAVERAKESPAVAHDLSSANTGILPLPDKPSDTYVQEIADNLHRLTGGRTADNIELMARTEALPSQMKDGMLQEKFYRYNEGEAGVELSPEEGKLYQEYYLPLKREEADLYDKIQAMAMQGKLPDGVDINVYDPTYMHRMVQGKTLTVDRLAGEGADENPLYSHPGPGILSRTTSSMRDRTYFTMENELGERRLVRLTNEGKAATTSDKQPPMTFNYSKKEGMFRPGESVVQDGHTWTMKNAWTSEIEANTQYRYYKNAWANTLDNVLHLRSAERAAYTLQALKDTPEWMKYTSKENEQPDWIFPEDNPFFRNTKMPPKMAYALDDFWGHEPKENLADTLEKLNRWAIGTLFTTPFPHIFNTGAFWAVERSFDNLTPQGMLRLIKTGPQAIKEVMTHGPKYQQLLREGSALVHGGLENGNFYENVLNKIGSQLDEHPEGWAGLAKAAEMSKANLIRSWYKASKNTLWAVSDMFMMQRVLELEEKGMATRAAIEETERTIPNYRVPGTILGQRSLQQAFMNDKYFEFSRYHYGIMKAYANMAKDLTKGTAAAKVDAVGKIMVLGALSTMVWPAISALIQTTTNHPDWKVGPFGPSRLVQPAVGAVVNSTPSLPWPKYVRDYYADDNGNFLNSMKGLFSFSPAFRMAGDTVYNAYQFTGKPVYEQADVRNHNWGRVASQMAEHAAETLVEPYNMVNEAIKKGKTWSDVLAETAFGLRNRGEDEKAAQQRAFHYQDREAKSRAKKPQGEIEKLATP